MGVFQPAMLVYQGGKWFFIILINIMIIICMGISMFPVRRRIMMEFTSYSPRGVGVTQFWNHLDWLESWIVDGWLTLGSTSHSSVANEGSGWDSPILKMVHNPGGDWHPGWGVDPSWPFLFWGGFWISRHASSDSREGRLICFGPLAPEKIFASWCSQTER